MEVPVRKAGTILGGEIASALSLRMKKNEIHLFRTQSRDYLEFSVHSTKEGIAYHRFLSELRKMKSTLLELRVAY